MKNMFKNIIGNKSFLLAFLSFSAILFSLDASAAGGWAKALETGTETLNAVKSFVVVLAYTLGTIIFFGGLYLVYKDGKEEGRGHMKNGITGMVIGAIMLIFPTAIGWSVVSVGGEESDMETEITQDF